MSVPPCRNSAAYLWLTTASRYHHATRATNVTKQAVRNHWLNKSRKANVTFQQFNFSSLLPCILVIIFFFLFLIGFLLAGSNLSISTMSHPSNMQGFSNVEPPSTYKIKWQKTSGIGVPFRKCHHYFLALCWFWLFMQEMG